LLATCPQEKLRDGKTALDLAQKALLLDSQNISIVETLAAAYAQCGQFPKAVEKQKKWIQYLKDAKSSDSSDKESKLSRANKRLELYQNNQLDIEPETPPEQ